MKLRLPIRFVLFICFQLCAVFAFSQTVGGVNPSDDFDGDGIINSIDIDDDNDGIPDTDEYCSSSVALPATNTTAGITEFSVPAGWVITNSSPDIATTAYSIYGNWISGCSGTAPAAPNGHTSWVNFYSNTQEAFKTTLSGLVVGRKYIFKVYYAKFASTAALGKVTVKLGTTVIDEYTPALGCGWETRFITFTAASTSQDLQFQNTGVASPMQNASVSVSSDALYEVCDTDNDGLPNQFDLDSDGDGCPDAKEAGVTGTLRNGDMKNGANGGVVTTTVSTAGAIAGGSNTYGANGLADGIETVAESGVVNYTSTYKNYALSNTANICTGLDTDGDGVVDLTDLDDDNDGILDEVETAWCKPLTATTIIPVGKTYGVTAASFGSYLPAVTAGLDATTCMSPGQVTTLTYEFGKTVNNPIIGFYGVDYAKEEWFDLNDNPVKLRILDASGPTSVSNNILTLSTSPIAGANTAATSAMGRVQVYGNVTGLKVKHTWLLTSQNCDNHGFSFLEPTECLGGPNPDSDGDGVINSLDLDSDGDGCFDAIEAGVLSSTSTGKVTGTYGNNGFENSIETVAENGIYNSVYSYSYAIYNKVNACLDSDGDGIKDLFDLDDDNDGILDSIEQSTCANGPTYTFSNIDGSSTGALAYNAAFPAWMKHSFTESEGGFKFTFAAPVTDIAFEFASIYQDDRVGDFSVKLADGTVLNGIDFDLSTTYGPTASIWTPQPNNVNNFTGNFSKFTGAPFNTGTPYFKTTNPNTASNQSWGIVHLKNIAGANTVGIAEVSFKIIGGSATSGTGGLAIYTSCLSYLDTDIDGIPNTLDLDSDGDECPDAKEANIQTSLSSGTIKNGTIGSLTTTTAANAIAGTTGNYGENGFANVLETLSESGIYNGTYYYNYAINSYVNACVDSDSDGVVDAFDLDDDNDGILDTVEMTNCNSSVLITPSAATSSPVYGGSTADLTIDGSGFTGSGLNALATAPATLNDAWLLKEPLTSGFIEYEMPAGSNVGGVALWAPDAYNYGGGDGPPKDFKVEVTYDGGRTFTSQIFTTAQPNSSGALAGAQAFYFTRAFYNVSKIRLNILSGWYDINNNSVGQISTEGITVHPAYNMFLGEFRVLCGSVDLDTDNDGIPNRLDLDSDGDGCNDAVEAGVNGVLGSGSVKNGLNGVVTSTTNLSNAIAAAPYGTNGLADGVETTAGSGLIGYNSTYLPFAVNQGLAACADTDADGIMDNIDLDDDNDGVLDETELSCVSPLNAIAPTVAGAVATYENNKATFKTLAGSLSKVATRVYDTSIDVVQLAGTSSTSITLDNSYMLLKFLVADLDQSESLELKVYDYQNNLIQLNANNLIEKGSYVNFTYPANISIKLTANGSASYDGSTSTLSNALLGIPQVAKRIEIYKTAGANNSWVGLFAGCNDQDTDHDGKLNRLDLDSDGDGCSDAIEAGSSTTATSITNYPTGTDANTNGLLDNYEGSPAGTINYSSKYDPYALSQNLAACKDTDGDGISDNTDLDDDNDGILDAVESSDCFYTSSEWRSGNRSDIIVTSPLTMVSPQNNPQKLVDGFNYGTSYDVRFASTSGSVNAVGSGVQVYKFDMKIPVKLSKVYLGYTSTATQFSGTPILSLRGSNDGITWTNLNTGASYDATISANSATETTSISPYPNTTLYSTSANIFSVSQNAAKYQFYDIYWVSGGGISVNGYANEVYFDVATDYNPSGHPKVNCGTDTDGDGVLNHLDLDSDGDACPDAKEAGITATLTSASVTNLAGATIASGTASSTIANAIVSGGPSTFGTNGFANALETSSESGLYNGTYDYSNANNKAISTCLDSDGDGASDYVDLDDDNDGVLDIVECPVPGVQPLLTRFDIASGATKTLNMTGFPEELWIDVWTIDNNFNLKVNGVNITSVSELNFAPMGGNNMYSVPFTDVVRSDGSPIYPANSVWFYPTGAQYPLIRVKINRNGYSKVYGYDFVNGTGNYQELVLVNAVYQKVPINLSGNNAIVFGQDNTWAPSNLNAEFNSYSSAGFCDTDGDGVENRLDLDSDGDGCSDAYEAKTTTSTTANFQYANSLPYGANGFLNTLETSDNGIYNGYYPYDFAINSGIKGCLDSDGDGVPDLNDLDDDNDGILDAVESPTCFYTLKELAIPVAVSSDLLPYDATATYALSNSIDDLTSTYSAFKSGQFFANKEILKYTANGLIDITSLTLDLDFRAISTDASSTFRFQGSADNVIWDNLNTAAVSSMNYTPPATLVLTNNLQAGKKYKYFRLYGVAGTSNFGGVANATFNLGSSNRSSANPKLTCASDTDGDGIPNHLDLDSDGDACPDAKEAGVIGTLTTGSVVNLANPNAAAGTATSTTSGVSNAIAGGSYGANGFANALQTATESGLYSGTYIYDYAITKTFNACADTDSDGVPDLVDIDDDNDGILDAVESPTCFYNSLELSQPTAISTDLLAHSTAVIGNAIDASSTTYSAFAPSVNWVGKTLFNLTALAQIPISGINLSLSTWALSNPSNTAGNTFKLQGSNDNNVWTDLSAAVSSSGTTGTLNIANTLAANAKFKYFQIVGVAGASYYGGVSDINFVISSNFVQSQFTKPVCTGSNPDGDAAPNYLDLDSDGDGCSDALESGTTLSTTANFKFTSSNNVTDFGANGFYNSLEKTSAESNLYKGIYTYAYATDNAINACTDFDGDGAADLFDLDDDNDGVLDAVESPTCFYTLTQLAQPIAVSTDLAPYSTTVIGSAIDTDLTSYSAFAPSISWVNKEIFKFTAQDYIAISGITFNLVNWPISSDANQTFKLQGSGDNMNWTDLSAASASTLNTGTYTISNTLATSSKFKYYRLLGVAGNTHYGGVQDAKFNLSNATSLSAYPSPTCTTSDTDGDTTPNFKDLDSDGDGCSDAFESGATTNKTANFKFTGTAADFGANGFYNSLEKTSPESNLYKGLYTYYYAIDNTANGCSDSDADGVSDLIDLDDDNDGVLDYAEQSCATSSMSKSDITVSSALSWTFQNAPTGLSALFDGSIVQQIYPNDSGISNKTVFQFNFLTPRVLNLIELANNTNQIPFVAGGTYKIQGSNDEGTTWSDIVSSQVVANSAPILATTNSIKFDMPTNYKSFLSYRIYAISMTGQANWSTEVYFRSVACTDLDTDNDGIKNRLDLDSDGDNCPDAVESGATAISTSGVSSAAKLSTSTIPAPYGNNGFANGLETSTESGAFTGTYTYNFATSATSNACADSDGDGVGDIIDLDDDNDGILDTIEDNCTVAVVNKTGAIITKPSTINYTFNGNTISNLIDGIDNNVYVVGAPTGTLNGPWLNFEFPSPKALTYLEIGHYSGQYLFSTTSTYKIQGSSDNTNWTDVSGTLTYNNVATSTSGGLSTVNSNIANFSSNTTAYKYYRILGINASAGAGWATEIYFKEFVCATADLDNDGIPNRLDLDSDGDGCPDAVEAGTTAISTSGVSSSAKLSTSKIPAPYGNNGFADGLETSTESGVYKGTYTNSYALDASFNACTDTDGDGLADYIDIDDDNDGVLDIVECASSSYKLYTYNYPTASNANNVPVNISGLSSQDVLLDQRTNGVAPNTFTYNSISTWKLVASNIQPSSSNTITVKIAPTASTTATYVFADAMLITNGTNTYVIDNNTTNTGGFNLTGTWSQQTVANAYNTNNSYLTSPAYPGNTATWTFANLPGAPVCDTDGDGIPNSLDLDSDGDGCADAIEAGSSTTARSLTTYPTGTDTNGNGLLNVYETTPAGTISYTSTYSLALLKNVQNCGDYDGDGILDAVDIDDDNDGVLDTVEQSSGADIDTDGDGIPNRFDLDSDGDGCSDAIESGSSTTATSTSIFPTGTDTNTNGLLNVYESASAGVVNYTSTYAANALVVTTIPSITTQPTSRFVAVGTPVSFTVATTAAQTGKTITYKWYRNGVLVTGATSATYTITSPTALSSGSYTCEVGYANSCSVTSNVAKLTVLSTQPTNATICQGLNGTLSVVVNSPEALTYQWMKGTTVVANGAIISGATSANLLFTAPTTADNGSYTCVITTASGLTLTSAAATLTVNAYPTISSTNTVCLNGTIALTGSATAAIALPWISSNTAVGVITGTTFTGLSAGTTVLTYTNNVGCSVTQSVSVKALPVISGTLALCGSLSSSQLTGTPSPALTSPWLSSNTAIATVSSTGLVTPVSTYTQGGTISITYKNTDNCTAVASVVISPKPVVATPPADKIVCLNATSTTFTAPATAITGVTFTYQWKRSVDGGNTWANITAGNASSLDAGNIYSGYTSSTLTVGTAVIGLNNAKYQVVITPSVGSCTTTSDIATLTVIPVPVIALQPSNSTLCTTAATSFTVATTTVSGLSYNYQWEYQLAGTSTWTAISASNASTALTGVTLSNYLTSTLNLSAAPLSASNAKFRCVITSKIGTVVCGSTNSAEAILNPTPVAPTITSSAGTSFCSGSNTTLTASSSTSGAKYRWYLNSAVIGGAYTSTLVVNSSGAYSVEAYLDGGCSISSASVTTITVNPLPTASITQGNSVILGTTGSTTLTANDAPAGQTYTYLWEKLVSGTWTSLSVTSKVYSVTATGTYRVKVITAFGCEAYSTPTDITAIPDASANGSTVFCQGGSVVISTTLPAGATKIQWYGGTNGTTAIGSPTDALSITATESGQYRAYFLKQDGSTTNYIAFAGTSLGEPTNTTNPVTVTVNPLPTASITEGSVAAFCADQPVLLHATGGGTYQWMLSGNALSGITSASYTPTVSGDYSVKVTDAITGCVATSSATAVTVNPLPSTPILKQYAQTICIDNSFDLTSIQPAPVSGIAYEWHLGTASNSAVLSPTTIPAGTSAGTTHYYLFAKSTAGCFSSSAADDALTIVSVAAPDVSSSNQQYNLGATPTALSAVSSNGYELRWWNAASSGTLLNAPVLPLTSPVGVVNYYVDQFDRNGSSCASPRQLVTVTIIPNGPDISGNTGINGNVIAYCQNAVPATLTASGIGLKWYTTSTGGTATTTAPTPSTATVGTTSYFVSQTVNGSESPRSEIQVSVSASVSTPSLTITQTTCLVATGDVVVGSPTGSGYTYSADGISFQSSPTLSGLNPGTYSITVKNSLGCTAALAATINAQPSKPVAPKVTLIQPACGQSTGTITISTPTDASYTYSIDGINYQSSRAFSGVAPGTYQVSVMAGAGCESLVTNAVINSAPATPVTPRAYVVHPTCTLATGTINIINSAAGYTHSLDGVNFQSSDVFTGLIPGTYLVYMKNASGCVSAPASIVVDPQPGIPAPAIVNITQTTCTVSTGSLTVVSPIGNGPSGSPFQYSIDGNTFQTSVNFTGLSPNTYYVYVRDGATGCSSKTTGTYVINEQPATPAAPSISSSAAGSVCAGTSVTLTSSASSNNQWYESGNLIKGAIGSTLTTSLPGVFTVITTNAAGCSSLSSTAETVTINPVPSASIAQGTTLAFTDCSTTSINLTAQTSGASPTYLWYKDGIATGITTSTLAVSAAGSYTVEITDAGCTSNSAVSKVLSLPTTSTATTQACQGGSILISANTTGYTSPSYQWEVLSGGTWTNVSSGGTSATYSATVSGSYRVTVTHSGGISSSCPVDVTILALPTFSVNPALTASICAGSTTNLTGASAATGVSYQWKISGTSIAGANTITLTTGLAGSYTLQITDENGCQAESSPSVVTVNSYPVVSVSASPALVSCAGSPITLTATSTGSPTYQWQLYTGSNWGNVSSSGTSSTYSATATGSYRVVVTSNSCSSNSAATAVTIATVSTPTLSLNQPTCILPSGSITVNTPVGSGYSYSKDGINFQTGTIFTGLSGATYTIRARDANGCLSTATAPQTISASPTPAPATPGAISGNIAPTVNVATTYSISPVSGAVSYTWTLPNGWAGTSTSTSITATPSSTSANGNITVRANGADCSSALSTLTIFGLSPDTDGDGVSDSADLDNDNDGILDSVENAACSPAVATCDTDGDGIPNRLDLDSDGDGISDVLEGGGTDADFDGKADGTSDSNGVPSSASGGLTPPDTDGTGGSNPYDLDADGDGMSDVIEGGGTDANNDGKIDTGQIQTPIDSDGDGIPDYRDKDSDNDGILDLVEIAACSPSAPNCDTDGDGIPNRFDLDSDGDGISDVIEAGGTDANNDGKADGAVDVNGVPSSASGGLTPPNTDGTGGTNPYDVDSDGDGILDSIEKGSGTLPVDTDGDGIPDYKDLDSDGDGILDSVEKGSGALPLDTDGDGIPDYLDTDSDGDGNPDNTDSNRVTPRAQNDLLVRDSNNNISGNILANDDFLPGVNTSITRLSGSSGGTAAGTVSFDPLTGVMTYVPAAGESGSKTVVYQVCNTLTNVCATATVTIDVCDTNNNALDCDGDGVSNGQERTDGTDPLNSCSMKKASQNMTPSSAWLAADCDNDGNPNATDPNPPVATAKDDALVRSTDGSISGNILSNDDFLPGSGTSLARLPGSAGGTAAGTVSFNASTGVMTYIPTAGETGVITVVYQVCNIATSVCATATITISICNPNDPASDCDGDGVSNGQEKLDGTDPDDACSMNFASQKLVPNAAWLAADCDGDGVSNRQERTDGTDPIDACSYLPSSQTIANTSAAWKAADCDGDGTPNGTDKAPLDFCVDGLSGAVPVITSAQYKFFTSADCDNDGIVNGLECYGGGPTCQDFDFDGIPNYLDSDSDNDGLPDIYEQTKDSDKDGRPDYLDLDSDNDGILDGIEGSKDSDGDGIPNCLDLDSDADGILDAWEAADVYSFSNDYGYTGTVKNADGSFPDVNGNGLADFLETSMGGTPRGPQDTDRDGIPDYLDWDSDGDYIADVLEQTSDMDKDNRPNYRDLDSDGDLIPDNIETITDTDGDGRPNYLDLDSDGDGVPDRVEGVVICESCASRDDQPDGMDDRSNGVAVDTDKDGKPDYLDTDSDNDGIPDSVEAGKDPSKPVDTDGDGTPDFRDTDSDNDGIPDSVEAGKDPNKPVDTDGDGKPDYLDTDSDNDGIPDSVEAGKDPSKPVDTDGDGKPDYLDLDSDGDGIPDRVEAGKDPNKPVDTDGDGKPDYQDTDSDNDGIPDSVEAGKDPNKPVDTDGDGTPDYIDLDSDNDGIPDKVEAGKDPSKPVDTDGDGKPDYIDTDSDNDGIPDSVEAGKDPNKPVDTDGDGKPDYLDTDSDNDGIPDAVEAGKDPNKPVDTDSDGKPDYLDTDSDNDGIPDSVEAGKDPQVPVDTDKDGIPDYRDLDSDGDGIPDKIEAGKDPSKPVDTDGDGKPDYIDTDSDNDGIPDAVEAGNVNNPVDTDGDGKPDYQDTDSDNDGIPDKIEAGADPTKPVDTDGDGTPDYRDLDSDNDGYSDKEEAGKDPNNPVDTDKDGKPDYQDTDSDNDGILDKLENDINYGALADCDKDGVDNRIDADQCPTFAPNGISPNGDGKNDVLIIPGILRNQPNELTIFNRWGNIVYQTSNYKNDWGGQTDRAFSLLAADNLLPDGTYYYVIDFFGKYPNVGTYVYINRQEK